MHDDELLAELGVRIRETMDLDEGVIWMPTQRIVLVDIMLSRREIDEAIAEILPQLYLE